MVTEMLETERKYEADAETQLPALAGLPGVAAESEPAEFRLDAEYFDTDDLRLLRAGITLRRRHGGDDAGWHLKLPAGQYSRTELHLPPGRSRTVPAELARLVRVHSRGTRLGPVARIETVRRQRLLLDGDGTSLAEVVDDEVSAQSLGAATTLLHWREIEVELTGGGRKLLEAADGRLRQGGLRPSARSAKLERVLAGRLPAPVAPPKLKKSGSLASEVVLAYLAAQVDALKAADPAVRRDEPDSVHQMRVTSRRLRAVLQTFTAVLDPAVTRQPRDELQWLGQLLGEARDGEVFGAHLQETVDQLPAELVLGPVQASVTETVTPRTAAARRAALRALDSPRYFALLDELDGLLAEPPLTATGGRPATALLGPVGRADRQVRRRFRRAAGLPAGPDRDLALHEARKAAKRARYAAEVVTPVFGDAAGRFARRMQQVQSVLGDHQDTVVARAAIRDLGIRAHLAGDNAFTYGLLYERDACDAATLQQEAWHVWERAARPKYRRWLS
jgi:CHAD domain-containing protein